MKQTSAATREKRRQVGLASMDCPLRRAIIGRKIKASWRDPVIRSRRVAAAKASWGNPDIRRKRIAGLLAAARSRREEGRHV